MSTELTSISEFVEDALAILQGVKLWGATRASEMQVFSFGGRIWRSNRRNQRVAVGEFALHLQCPWRLSRLSRILIGSDDWYRNREENPTNVLLKLIEDTPRVITIAADDFGGFHLEFDRQLRLEVFPAHSERGEYSEHWRLLRGRRHDFVVTGEGIEQPSEGSLRQS
jgi:hypothetical protein